MKQHLLTHIQYDGTSGSNRCVGRIPFRMGVPFARGIVRSADAIRIVDVSGAFVPIQTSVLDIWPDGSIRWCLLDWLATQEELPTEIQICDEDRSRHVVEDRIDDDVEWLPSTNTDCTWQIRSTSMEQFVSVRLRCVDSSGSIHIAKSDRLKVLLDGPVRKRIECEFGFDSKSNLNDKLVGKIQVDLHRCKPDMICRIMMRNTQPASHPNGNWDLGNKGSILLEDVSLEFEFGHKEQPIQKCDGGYGQLDASSAVKSFGEEYHLFQASSGGENWDSTNHIDRDRRIPMRFKGYQLTVDGISDEGLRASPQAYTFFDDRMFGIAIRRFWENFPKVVQAKNGMLRLGLFPHEADYPHELQGGEQKTHEFAVYFGRHRDDSPLNWFVDPMLPRLHPEYYSDTQAIPYLTPQSIDPNQGYLRLVEQAIDGADTFLDKREKIDEYGWRHFGDIYGDHEAVYHGGSKAMISHYNNQYDCVVGFATQFLRTGEENAWVAINQRFESCLVISM